MTTDRATWLTEKREEARRLHLAAYREWIKDGAAPAPINGGK